MIALIDGDPLVYGLGFASQRENNGYVDVLPESTVLNMVDNEVWRICEESGADDYKVFLSGSKNFRSAAAKTVPYKGNRQNLQKPYYYDSIRSYLRVGHKAKVSDGIEADDELRIAQVASGNSNVVCGVDKDLRQIVGLHYNPRTKTFFEVDEDYSNYWFWYQTLVGDVIDNIKGVRGMGPKRSEKLLKDLSPDARKEKCRELYANDERLQESGVLLHLLRSPDDFFDLHCYPDIPDLTLNELQE